MSCCVLSGCGATMVRKHWRMHMFVSSTPQQLEQRYWRTWYFQVKQMWLCVGSDTAGADESISLIELIDLFVRYWSIHHSWWTHSLWGRCWKQVRQQCFFESWAKLKIICVSFSYAFMDLLILSCSFFLSNNSIGKVCSAKIKINEFIFYDHIHFSLTGAHTYMLTHRCTISCLFSVPA